MLTWLPIVLLCGAPGEDLNCLPTDAGQRSPPATLYGNLQRQAAEALAKRDREWQELKTAADVEARQAKLREFFVQQLGGFPPKTPLNSQVVGKLSGDGYRIEKVIFESQPQHHVTANLYVPDGQGPFPGVIVSSGHSRTAKTAAYNQRFGIMLARHGMAALCYDPIGQGERSQILTPDGTPQFAGTTTEHFLMGVGSILVGRNTASYRVWDGMRAIDYLTSRDDIDPQRIGMTGCSGGGTLTSYVMALDDRVACAAPACYLTTFAELINTIGPQDAEQNIHAQIAYGMDQPDYVLMRAPRPTIISATTNDFFGVDGTWDNYRQSKRIYSLFGFPERMDLVEADGDHGVQPTNLAAITQWMRRWLLGKDGPVPIEEIEVRSEAELRCLERGQVLLLPGEKSVFDLNAQEEKRLAKMRREFWSNATSEDARATVRRIAGIRPLAEIPEARRDKAGKVSRDDYHIDKLVLHADSGIPLPALTFHPQEPQEEAYLYLHDGGKAADGAVGGPIEKLVKEGHVVVSIDLRGQGETATGKPDALLGDWKSFYLAYLLGKPLVGMHAEDTLVAGRFIANYETKTPRKVHLVAVGNVGIAALHAAALEPDLFASVTLQGTPASWSKVVGQPVPSGRLTTTIHGALRAYDLPDLIQFLGEDKVERTGAP